MCWKSLTMFMPMASTGDNERICGNILNMKMMHTPLPQYYDKLLIYVHSSNDNAYSTGFSWNSILS